MRVDLTSLPPLLIVSVLNKMDYQALTRVRQTSKGIGDFIDRARTQIHVFRSVSGLQFLQDGAYVCPTLADGAFLQKPDTVAVEFPFLRTRSVEFRSLGMSDTMKYVHSVKSRGLKLIVNDISEPAVIYLSSILRPKVLSSENIEFSRDILFQPGFQDLETIVIMSPQEFIDLSPCALKTKELAVDMSYGECPDKDILRLLKMWECGQGNLSRLELNIDEEFENLDLCTDMIRECGAYPIFIREIHDFGPLSLIAIEKFKNPHYDRLMIMSNRAEPPHAGVILFQRGKFTFEACESFDIFYDTLNKHGNAIFVDDLRLNFCDFITVQDARD